MVPREPDTPVREGNLDPSAPVRLTGARWWMASGLVLLVVLLATLPTTGDIGLTWDEPAYRYSQIMSAQWWERLGQARTVADLTALCTPDMLLYYWPYGRFGRNFHPPLAGQLNLATHALFGRWVKDIPSRRLASVFEYALTIVLGFGFLARRYGAWVGGVMAGALLCMPRVYGDGHIAGTDAPGLLLWAATSLAFWKGIHEPGALRWRVAVGFLLGLAFVEKMGAVLVLGPIVGWLVLFHLPRAFALPGRRGDWVDGIATTTMMLIPLAVAFVELLRLTHHLPPPKYAQLFHNPLSSAIPGAILAVPALVWVIRRILGRIFRNSSVWGVERPALETWTAILAFAPLVGWLGNPAWWRLTLPHLAHYYMLNKDRKGALPDIRILYQGEIYNFSLPWHNAWVLIAITVPATLLAAAALGLVAQLARVRRDHLPIYFLLHMVTLPILRMFNTPAHDGVRLFLPTFFFLAAFVGWGTIWLADRLGSSWRRVSVRRSIRSADCVLSPSRGTDELNSPPWEGGVGGVGSQRTQSGSPVATQRLSAGESFASELDPADGQSPPPLPKGGSYEVSQLTDAARRHIAVWARAIVSALVLVPAALQLVAIHPFELSYYNELIGGPKGAWKRGYELTYWYDAFNAQTLNELNQELPRNAIILLLNDLTPLDTFLDLQALGQLRRDLVLDTANLTEIPYVWLLSQDSKASTFTRLLFAMKPWYARRPHQLGGVRVATVADPVAVSRAWLLHCLVEAKPSAPLELHPAPAWARRFAPLARLWGEGLSRVAPPILNESVFDWARRDPDGLLASARFLADDKPLLDWARRDPELARHALRRMIAANPDPGANATQPAQALATLRDEHPEAFRLLGLLARHPEFLLPLFLPRPEALPEAVEVVITRPESVRRVVTSPLFLDRDALGKYLDEP